MEDRSKQFQSEHIDVVNKNLVETDIKLLGDHKTIEQIVRLVAYIRHAIKNNLKTEISVKLGNNVINAPFAMSVNDQEIKDYITQKTIEIN